MPFRPKPGAEFASYYPFVHRISHERRTRLDRSLSAPSSGTPGTAEHTAPLAVATKDRRFAYLASTNRLLGHRITWLEDHSKLGRERAEGSRLLGPVLNMRYWDDRRHHDGPHFNYMHSKYP